MKQIKNWLFFLISLLTLSGCIITKKGYNGYDSYSDEFQEVIIGLTIASFVGLIIAGLISAFSVNVETKKITMTIGAVLFIFFVLLLITG